MFKIALIAFGVLLLLFTACDSTSIDTVPSEPSRNSESAKNLGTTPLLGTSQFIEGKTIPAKNIQLSARIVRTDNVFSEPQLASKYYPKTKTIALGKPKKISYGHDNFPPISIRKLGKPEVSYKQPEILPALPFQNEIHEKLSYKTLGLSQGLKSAFISSVFQDSRGYFWFGSRRGLTRYNTHSFQYYPFAAADRHRGIGAITEDLEGNLWMTFGAFGGLVKFDGHNFHEYNEGAGLNLGEQYLGIIHTDKKGNIWLKSDTQIIRFDGEKFTCFPYQFQNLQNLNVIIKENKDGQFWLSALGGVCLIEGDQMKYFAIEEQSENNLCHPVMEDEKGLVITTGTGITVLKNDSLHIYPAKFMANYDVRNTLTVNHDFVLATEQKKMAICSINDRFLTITSDNTPVFSAAHPLYIDKFENIWLSAPGKGIQCYNPKGFKHFKFDELQKGGNISAILEDQSGNIWLGSHGFGLYKYDGTKHTYIDLIQDRTEISIRSLLQDSDGNIWAGTVHFGVYKIENIDSPTPTVTRMNCFNGEDFHVFALEEDKDRNIWIGTRTKGLVKYDGKQFTHYPLGEKEPANIRALKKDDHGNLWIALENSGVKKFDGTNFTSYTTKDGLSSNHAVSLMLNSDGSIWIGTSDNGVNHYDGHRFTHITTKDGLSSNAIWTITEDAEKNIWLGADKCLNVLIKGPNNDEKYSIQTYCDLDGLKGAEFYANSGIMDQNKQLWWGTDQMALMLPNPKNILSHATLKISLEDLNLVNNQLDFKSLQDSIQKNKHWFTQGGDQIDLANSNFNGVFPFVNCPEELSLPPTINDLKFIYSARGAKSSADLKFSYFMEGIDKDWSIPSTDNTINYRGIPSGTYTLRAKVSEINGVWSEPHSYTFTILPFWWETWWAYTLWVLIGIAIIWSINKMLNIRRKEKADAEHIKEMDAVKGQLYANITHEFRTPLTLIIGMNEQIEGHEKEKTIIRRNSEKLLLQINQLLDASKLDSGNIHLDLIQYDIISYIQFLTESFHGLAADNGIKLTFYAEVKQLNMDYDEQKIQAIVYNLLSNAIKFTPKDGSIICHLSEIKGNHENAFQLKITDSGIGIAASEVNNIFDRFYQANNVQKGHNTGSGIGLALTKSLVELMSGTITVESTIDQGTSFTLTIPVHTNCSKIGNGDFIHPLGWGTEKTLKNDPATSIKNDDPDALNLLIIEDNEEIANYLDSVFNSTYNTHIAENGKIGVSKAFDIIPDAIISDIAMPEMDGYEVCEILKQDERTSHIPIILLTAKTAQEEKMSGLQAGADLYITKPFYKDELKVSLQKLIDVRQKLQVYYSTLGSEITEEPALVETKFSPVEEAFLEKLNTIIEAHLTDADFGIPELSRKAGLSQMQVYRKLKALTDKTPSQFIRSYRLNKGLKLIQTSDLNISEVAYEVGFSDPNYFSRTFHKEFGNPPLHFRS
ncbi:MAG: signal transduction histidine kinase/ligand-binding sensor domain-containing protein [Crocinitomicaceae bacterium]|jgi:signal transduction histidine kinase/ligand-binding sensor domain-containing protein/DNA-binding response OmpR family regulator